MNPKISAACAWMPFLLALGTAEAATYDLYQAATPFLATGTSYTAAFDARLLIDPAAQHIDTATLVLNFVGGEQRVQGASTVAVTASGGGVHAYDYTDNYADGADRALVLLEGSSPAASPGLASAPYYETDTVTRTQDVGYYQTTCQIFVGCSTYYVYVGTNRYIDHVAGYKGSFSYLTSLDAAQVSAFNADSIFQYGFTVGDGSVQLASAEITFNTSPVPEPQTLALMVAGLAVLGMQVRRRGRAGPST